MGQRRARALALLFLLISGCVWIGCDRAPVGPSQSAPSTTTAPAAQSAAPITVASLVPAATDLLLGMGAADNLVAVSNYDDQSNPLIADLPQVGDYRSVDWEKLITLRPDVMIVQYRADKMPPGLEERARELGITLVNVAIYRLDDVFVTLLQLGNAIGEPEQAIDAIRSIRAQLDAVQQRVEGRDRVRTMLSMTNPLFVAGGGTVLDDVLTIAGGQNVVGGEFNTYPTLDREQVLTMNPNVVINLMPSATPQDLAENRRFWDSLPQVSAVASERVHQLTQPYLLLHGSQIGTIAEIFADHLHPDTATTQPAATRPTTEGAP